MHIYSIRNYNILQLAWYICNLPYFKKVQVNGGAGCKPQTLTPAGILHHINNI
jgi:hypothetical protein